MIKGGQEFFPRFCRCSEAKLGKQSEQYNISIKEFGHFDKFVLFLVCRYINL